MQADSETSGQTRSKLRPALSEPAVVHEHQVKASLQSALLRLTTCQNVGFHELQVLSLDGRSDANGGFC